MNKKVQQVRDLAWSAMQRLQFIEFRLLWEGHVNRSDLIETFKISVPQSTLDFREYLERAPGNMDYDKQLRHYFPTPAFKPVFISDSAEGYLSQLTSLGVNGEEQSNPGLIGAFPPFEILPLLNRRVDSDLLQQILRAIRENLALEIYYQSLTTPSPEWRWLEPHALASDGLRWHIRAYCHNKSVYRDFVLGRILEIRGVRQGGFPQSLDDEWNEIVNVVVSANPDLTVDQRTIIERDFAMTSGKAEIKVRRALLFYLKNNLGVEHTPEKKPAAQQVIISKIEKIS